MDQASSLNFSLRSAHILKGSTHQITYIHVCAWKSKMGFIKKCSENVENMIRFGAKKLKRKV